MERYNIKENYTHREIENYLDVTNGKDEAQNEVYQKSFEIAKRDLGVKSIADFGCGSGFKLFKYFSNYETIGYDLKPTIDKLKERYPDKQWEISDYNVVPKKADLVICTDVIEHVLYPNDLLEYILKMQPKYVVISTPDRNTLGFWGRLDGPPFNVHHIREWTKEEFTSYISRWFDIEISENVPQSGYEYMLMVLRPKLQNS